MLAGNNKQKMYHVAIVVLGSIQSKEKVVYWCALVELSEGKWCQLYEVVEIDE